MRKALEQPIIILEAVSPDGRWLVGWSRLPGNDLLALNAHPLGGGTPLRIGGMDLQWSRMGDFLSITGEPIANGRSYVVPLPPAEALPPIPPGGFSSEQEVARLPGARRIDALRAVPGPSRDIYAFYHSTTQRNLYRIPIP